MDEYQKLTKTLGNLKKIADFKNAKMIKNVENHSVVTRNYAVPY